jgi:hypothetical protein
MNGHSERFVGQATSSSPSQSSASGIIAIDEMCWPQRSRGIPVASATGDNDCLREEVHLQCGSQHFGRSPEFRGRRTRDF